MVVDEQDTDRPGGGGDGAAIGGVGATLRRRFGGLHGERCLRWAAGRVGQEPRQWRESNTGCPALRSDDSRHPARQAIGTERGDDTPVRVAFIGLGLIGGSLALATRSPDRQVVAWTPRGDGPRAALAAGAIDEVAATREEAVEGADLVILAAPALERASSSSAG